MNDLKKLADVPQGGNIMVPIILLIIFIIVALFIWRKFKDRF